jgi:hypothetical protein
LIIDPPAVAHHKPLVENKHTRESIDRQLAGPSPTFIPQNREFQFGAQRMLRGYLDRVCWVTVDSNQLKAFFFELKLQFVQTSKVVLADWA